MLTWNYNGFGKNLGTWEQQVFPSGRKSTATNRRNSNTGF